MATREEVGGLPGAAGEQTDFDKIRRIPFLYGFAVLNSAAMLCCAGATLPLYAAELGVDKNGIGLLGGLMPFAQVLCIFFLPLVMRFGNRPISALGYGLRFLLLIPFLFAPMARGSPDLVFWILFASMSLFSVGRCIAETAVWPWSQEYTPKALRGRIAGMTAVLALPASLLLSWGLQLWLDSRTGVERFAPVYVLGIALGVAGGMMLFGLGGGRPRPGAVRGLDSIRAIIAPTRDRNFLAYLYSSGTQYFVLTAIGVFVLLYFHERLGISSGKLVLMSALTPLGGALGGVTAGWFVDRYGTRAIRVVLQALQVALLLSLIGINPGLPSVEVFVGAFFFLFGFVFYSATSVGSIYMLNYVPPAHKESYMALAYASDGIIGGGATFLAGALLQFLLVHPLTLLGVPVGNYELLFLLCAVIIATSAASFAMLREEGGTGVRDFLGQFRTGNPVSALWNIRRYDHLTSEERRRELAYGFGGTRSALVKEELIAALRDPSFDVRHEAIQSLGHLPNNPAVVRALESVLRGGELIELQNAALTALGRLHATRSGDSIARFLDHPNALLRARAMRTLGDIRDERFLPRIRALLASDPELDGRVAAVSALGKYRDRESVEGLVAVYRSFPDSDASMHGAVVLLALSKVLDCEAMFAREWRREEHLPGSRLPRHINRLAGTVRRAAREDTAMLVARLLEAAPGLAAGDTDEAFRALQALRPAVAASGHPDAVGVLAILDGTNAIRQPHRELIVLLCLTIRQVLQ